MPYSRSSEEELEDRYLLYDRPVSIAQTYNSLSLSYPLLRYEKIKGVIWNISLNFTITEKKGKMC